LLSFVSVSAQTRGNPNSPYTATKKFTLVQKLADGTTITRESTSAEARDSQGRTVQSTTTVMGGRSTTHTTVMDPVARTTTFWSSLSKQATTTHMPELRKISPQLSATTGLSSGPGVISAAAVGDFSTVSMVGGSTGVAAFAPDPNIKPARQVDKLGGKTIAGVYAEGTRTTLTYPVGSMGNDRPIVNVRETWTAPELNIIVLSTDNDPRNGVQTTELTDIVRAEPDPAIFQVPEGYTIKDHNLGSN
jgi:hypothetical protein